MSNFLEKLRRRAYDNIRPVGYENPKLRLLAGLLFNQKDPRLEKRGYKPRRDALWAKYLNIPEDQRHLLDNPLTITESPFKPSKSSLDSVYYTLPFTENEIDLIVKNGVLLNNGENHIFGDNKKSSINGLGHYTVGKGYDNKGLYVSVYDMWDIAPNLFGWNLTSYTDSAGNSDKGHLIGATPFEIYDRFYLDDYYNIPDDKRGTQYLPEIEVTPLPAASAKGGKLNYMKLCQFNS